MKIAKFRTLVLGTPWRNLTYLVLETDDGLTGLGEARVLSKTHTVLEYLKDAQRHFVGHDPFDVEALYRRMTLFDFGKPGEIVYTGLALVEMACWDIIGKACGQPVYRLLGGKVRDSVPAYANGWYTVERRPEDFALAAQKVMDRGYLAMKFDPFGAGDLELSRQEFHRSLDLIDAVHTVTNGRAQIMLEMHGRFAPHQAREIAKAVEKYEPSWIEEPTRPGDIPALQSVRQHTSLPIATGERLYGVNEFRELFARGLADIVQPDITQCGGILETKKIAAAAEMHSVMAAPHNVGGIVSTTAALHLCLTLRNGKILEHFNDFADESIKRAGTNYPEVVDGVFRVPDRPGWGVELDEGYIKAHPPRIVDGIVQDPGLRMFENVDWARRGQSRG
ncbi:MAG: mandelate racemase/muconate lactonizing enzyme family protein [Chloroflexi bacterium]|nr:mandelate racemase/muconate lactonizing enzyme family protein [Chloroflexota bacterium]